MPNVAPVGPAERPESASRATSCPRAQCQPRPRGTGRRSRPPRAGPPAAPQSRRGHAPQPVSSLPAITNPVLIDGFSEPGYSGTPLIELSGGQTGGGNGLVITGSGTTIRGLEIVGFVEGAGILISGTGATSNTIESDDIGTDPTGTQALPNAFGVQVADGASDNTIGGATAAAGNLIAFNAGPGASVEGTSSVGNQITANQVFSNDIGTTLQFDGSTYVSLPNDLVDGSATEQTIEARFETTSGGVILGYQASTAGGSPYNGWIPSIYVGSDGRLYGGAYDTNNYSLVQVTSSSAVNDGHWHHLALRFRRCVADIQPLPGW